MPLPRASRQAKLQDQLTAIRAAIFISGMGRDLVAYRALRRLGATAEEALDALVASGANPESRAGYMSIYLPRGLSVQAIRRILVRHRIHPLSVAVSFEDRRRAWSFLRRLDLLEEFGPWIGASGGLQIRNQPGLRDLPAGLALYGACLVADCPDLVNLGKGLVIQRGPLVVENCPRLNGLPMGFRTSDEGNVVVAECESFKDLPPGIHIDGYLEAKGCPRFNPQVLSQVFVRDGLR